MKEQEETKTREKQQTRHKGRTTVVIIVIGLLAFTSSAWLTMQRIRNARANRIASHVRVKVMPSLVKVTERHWTPEDLWYHRQPPKPGSFIRETKDYLEWKERFCKALSLLDKKGRTSETKALREWFHKFETEEIRWVRIGGATSIKPALSPMFDLLTVRRLIGPPPSPAFEKFHGYKIVLPWNKAVYYYEDNAIPEGTPFLLHPNGIRYSGTPVRQREDVHELFARAGITDQAAKDVLIRVSDCEGGFEAVNTWDTGYVSVGFIQFTTGEGAMGHSLLHVMLRMKADEARLSRGNKKHINEFEYYFMNRGIDARDDNLFVNDPYTGKTFSGDKAVDLIIKDKRLIAIFQDAGEKSVAFKLAQIREAYGAYYLAKREFSIPAAEISVYETPPAASNAEAQSSEEPKPQIIHKHYIYGEQAVKTALAECMSVEAFERGELPSRGEKVYRVITRLPNLTAKYGDVLQSEGGRVTLTDRAVQWGVRGTEETFEDCVNKMASDAPLTVEDLANRENQIIAAIRNRIDVLSEKQAETKNDKPIVND